MIPETSWDQKVSDIKKYDVDPRTDGISSSEIKQMLHVLDPSHITEMQEAPSVMNRLLEHYRDLT